MSANKRTSLDAVFASKELPTAVPPTKGGEKSTAERSVMAAPVEPESEGRVGGAKRPNVKQHTAYLPVAVHEQLRKLAFEENAKMHDYLIEGLDRVFEDRGLPSVRNLT